MASSSSPLPSSFEQLSLSSPSLSLTPVIKDGEYSNWSELPSELTLSILQRLDVNEILENVQKVCTSWRRISKDPSMWKKIVMHNLGDSMKFDLDIMCRHAVDLSQGGLVEIDIWNFVTDSLLNYIADSSCGLRSLKLAMCYQTTNEGLTEALVKLPLLEELEVSYCSLSAESLKVVGRSCPNLKTFKLNRSGQSDDDDALAIAETMHGLRNIQLFGNKLSFIGLNAILDNCPNLEHLDLRQCFNVNPVEDLEKLCSERIKVLRRPYDSTHDYPYEQVVVFHMSEDEYSNDSYMSSLDFGDVSDDHSDYNPYDVYDDPYDVYNDPDYM